MDALSAILLVSLGLMLFFLAIGLYIGVIMAMLAVIVSYLFSGHPDYLEAGLVVWPMMRNFILIALPLFILMGEILVRSGLTQRLYWALDNWFHVLPGGLLHTNIASCAVFASISGSSVATGATIGTVALPAFRRQQYNEKIVLGSLAAGGTLGILIPPSIAMIMYGLLTDTSIGRLFMGGVIPGICLAGLFMLFIAIVSLLRPEITGRERKVVSWGQRLSSLVHILPVLCVILVVLGSLYFGFATPSESAALGVVAALCVAAGYRKLSRRMVYQAMMSTGRTLAMVMLILMGTLIFNFVITLLGVPRALAALVAARAPAARGHPHPHRHLLPAAGDVHGIATDDHHDHSGHLSSRDCLGLRPGLVWHSPGSADGGGPHHPSRRSQPVRHPRGETDSRPHERRNRRGLSFLSSNGGDDGPDRRFSPTRALAAQPDVRMR